MDYYFLFRTVFMCLTHIVTGALCGRPRCVGGWFVTFTNCGLKDAAL